jgi:hypothetical protein
MLIAKFRIFVVLALTLTLIRADGHVNFRYERRTALDGKLFNVDVIFDFQNLMSTIQCADVCAATRGCLSFTSDNKVKCRGHNAVMTTTTANSTIGTSFKTYVAGWCEFSFVL